jgi:hypothetical protein
MGHTLDERIRIAGLLAGADCTKKGEGEYIQTQFQLAEKGRCFIMLMTP